MVLQSCLHLSVIINPFNSRAPLLQLETYLSSMKKLIPLLCCIFLIGCESSPSGTVSTAAEDLQVSRTDVEARLQELQLSLPTLGQPLANYVHAVQSGKLVFLAGKGPTRADGTRINGKLGADLTVEEGYEAARLVGLQQLAALKLELGDLSRVKRIVKVHGMVNATPDFTDHSKVINGFSDLMVEVFGEAGKHARAAVGMSSLPGGMAVEIEAIVEVY